MKYCPPPPSLNRRVGSQSRLPCPSLYVQNNRSPWPLDLESECCSAKTFNKIFLKEKKNDQECRVRSEDMTSTVGQSYSTMVPHLLPKDLAAAAAAESLQSCPTLCDPIDGSPPGSAVPGILQARGDLGNNVHFSLRVSSHT